uniref:Uncharacterized protein n=1 Tax=Triticum urartu TaxID=4572 RepID=A0A8R7UCQ0_TRIUA
METLFKFTNQVDGYDAICGVPWSLLPGTNVLDGPIVMDLSGFIHNQEA